MGSSCQCFIIASTNLFQVVTTSASESLSFKTLKITGQEEASLTWQQNRPLTTFPNSRQGSPSKQNNQVEYVDTDDYS